jgi:hypothetical protein
VRPGDLARALLHVFCTAHRVEVEGGRRVRVCTVEGPHAAIWQDSLKAYASHRCERCSASKRPRLVGVLAHTRGLDRTDSEAWRLRRAMGAALDAAAPRVALLARTYANLTSHREADDYRRPWTAADVERLAAALDYRESLAPVQDVPVPVGPCVAYDVETVERERVEHVPARTVRVDWQALRHGANRLDSGPRDTVPHGARGFLPSLFDARTLQDVEGAFTRHAPTVEVLSEAYDVTRRETVRTLVPRAIPSPLTDAQALDVVTVTTRTGETYARVMSEQEQGALQRERTREARYDGEAYGESAHRANVPDARSGAVGSGKAPAPRKRGSRGASGPNVPAGRHTSK